MRLELPQGRAIESSLVCAGWRDFAGVNPQALVGDQFEAWLKLIGSFMGTYRECTA
jgi:hypothetical protein